jgi:hypothetical protein
MSEAPGSAAGPKKLDVVLFSVSGWRAGFEARWIRSSSLAPAGILGNCIETQLGFSLGTAKVSAMPRQCLLIKSAGDDAKGDTEILVDSPVDLVFLPVANIHPVPLMIAARTRLRGLRALALEPEAVARQIILLFDARCLTDCLEKKRDSLAKGTDA